MAKRPWISAEWWETPLISKETLRKRDKKNTRKVGMPWVSKMGSIQNWEKGPKNEGSTTWQKTTLMKVMMGFLWDLTKAPLVVELAPSGLLSITSTAIYLIKIYFKGRRPKFYDNSFATPIYLVTRKIRPYYLKRALIIGTCLFNKSLSTVAFAFHFSVNSLDIDVNWTSLEILSKI